MSTHDVRGVSIPGMLLMFVAVYHTSSLKSLSEGDCVQMTGY